MAFVVGKCLDMCPEKEYKLRCKEKLVHVLEKNGKLVKEYKRSAAGVLNDSSHVRPPEVLSNTIHYLLNDVITWDKPYILLYSFIEDRLRSVRQDLFVQQPNPEICIPLLEPIVRFYSYSSYRLCDSSTNDFNSVLNHNQLLETFKWLLRCYDSAETESENRISMEALFILFNLGEPSSLLRSLNLPSILRTDLLLTAEKMSLAWFIGNYFQVCKLMKGLPALHAALTCSIQLPHVRRFGLKIICSAHSSKNLTIPLKILKNYFLYDCENEISSYLENSGASIQKNDKGEKHVQFIKTNWKSIQVSPKRMLFIDSQIEKLMLPEMLL